MDVLLLGDVDPHVESERRDAELSNLDGKIFSGQIRITLIFTSREVSIWTPCLVVSH